MLLVKHIPITNNPNPAVNKRSLSPVVLSWPLTYLTTKTTIAKINIIIANSINGDNARLSELKMKFLVIISAKLCKLSIFIIASISIFLALIIRLNNIVANEASPTPTIYNKFEKNVPIAPKNPPLVLAKACNLREIISLSFIFSY